MISILKITILQSNLIVIVILRHCIFVHHAHSHAHDHAHNHAHNHAHVRGQRHKEGGIGGKNKPNDAIRLLSKLRQAINKMAVLVSEDYGLSL